MFYIMFDIMLQLSQNYDPAKNNAVNITRVFEMSRLISEWVAIQYFCESIRARSLARAFGSISAVKYTSSSFRQHRLHLPCPKLTSKNILNI